MGAPLILRIASDTTQASSGVAKLAGDVVNSMNTVNSAIGTVSRLALPGLTTASLAASAAIVGDQEKIISILGRSTLAFLELRAAWILGGVAIAGALAGAREELDRFASIVDKARQAGVSNNFFQAFIKSADEAKVKVDTLEKALSIVRPNVLDNLDQPNKARETLDDILGRFRIDAPQGSNALQQFDLASSTEGRIRATIQAIRDLEAAFKATGDEVQRLAAIKIGELFGPDFADQIRRGNIDFDEFLQKLDRLKFGGAQSDDIIDNATLDRVKDLNDRIAAADRQIRDALRPAFDDLASAILSVKGAGVFAFEQLAAIVGKVGEVYVRTRDLIGLLSSIPGRIVTDTTTALSGNQAAGETVFDELGNPIFTTPSQKTIDNIQAAERLKSLQRALDRQLPRQPPRPLPRPDDAPKSKPAKTDSPDTSRQDQIDRFIESLEKEVRVVEAEAATFGRSNEEKAKANALARIGTEELTPKQIEQIEQLAVRQVQAKEATQKLREAQEAYNNAVRFAGTAVSGFLSDIVSGGRNAEEALSNLVKRLADAVLQAELLGDGPLASLLGTKGKDGAVGGLLGQLFSGLAPSSPGAAAPVASAPTLPFSFANGGVMSPSGPLALKAYSTGGVATGPQLALFGEGANNEAFVPLPDGRSIPVRISAPSLPAQSSSQISVIVNKAPLDPEVSSGPGGSIVIDFAAAMAREASNPSSPFFRALQATTGIKATGALR